MMLEGVWKTETKKEEEMQNCVHAEYTATVPALLGSTCFWGEDTPNTKGIRICSAVWATNKNKTNPKEKKERE
jgi:hypothetical protein